MAKDYFKALASNSTLKPMQELSEIVDKAKSLQHDCTLSDISDCLADISSFHENFTHEQAFALKLWKMLIDAYALKCNGEQNWDCALKEFLK